VAEADANTATCWTKPQIGWDVPSPRADEPPQEGKPAHLGEQPQGNGQPESTRIADASAAVDGGLPSGRPPVVGPRTLWRATETTSRGPVDRSARTRWTGNGLRAAHLDHRVTSTLRRWRGGLGGHTTVCAAELSGPHFSSVHWQRVQAHYQRQLHRLAGPELEGRPDASAYGRQDLGVGLRRDTQRDGPAAETLRRSETEKLDKHTVFGSWACRTARKVEPQALWISGAAERGLVDVSAGSPAQTDAR
jgi:hypothetical protein